MNQGTSVTINSKAWVYGGGGSSGSSGVVVVGGYIETTRAEKVVWLMKCPALVSNSLKKNPSDDDPSRPVAKVVLSIDPLNTNDENSSH